MEIFARVWLAKFAKTKTLAKITAGYSNAHIIFTLQLSYVNMNYVAQAVYRVAHKECNTYRH